MAKQGTVTGSAAGGPRDTPPGREAGPREAAEDLGHPSRGITARDRDEVVDGWTIDVEGVTPCCGATLSFEGEPVTCPGVVAEAFRCPLCDSLLRIGGVETVNAFELAPCPCEVCDWNDVPTEGPLCVHCNLCERHCDGDEYPEEWPEGHQFEPALGDDAGWQSA